MTDKQISVCGDIATIGISTLLIGSGLLLAMALIA
jgi:hypothetical protein